MTMEDEMNIIVAADKNWGIGYQNKLLVSIPSDMKFFRETTTGKVVVMGRKTLESFPKRTSACDAYKYCPDEKNGLSGERCPDLPFSGRGAGGTEKYDSEDIYVIGGEEIYREFLPYCDVAHVTRIDHEYLADAFFPDLDREQDWVVTADSEEQTYFDLEYTFLRYERRPNNWRPCGSLCGRISCGLMSSKANCKDSPLPEAIQIEITRSKKACTSIWSVHAFLCAV